MAGSEKGLRYRTCLAGALDALPIIMHADARQGWALPSCRKSSVQAVDMSACGPEPW